MTITEKARLAKEVSPILSTTSVDARNKALNEVIDALVAHKEEIFEANRADLAAAEEAGLSKPIVKRLAFNDSKLDGVISGIRQLISLPDPLHKTLLNRSLDEGLDLYRVSCPIGVIGVIFESRPDALVQISTLCIKSGNCAVLKGGKETRLTNRILFRIIYAAVTGSGLPEGCLVQAEDHSEISELLTCKDYIDLIIPRGSNSFVQYIMSNTFIPVMGHADGVCHIYVDKTCDKASSLNIIRDAKTQYTSVCNAVETILIDKKFADDFIPDFYDTLTKAGVSLHGNSEFIAKLRTLCGEDAICEPMEDDSYHTEYLDYTCSCKLVDGVEEAISHINRFGSHHTDCILSTDKDTVNLFMERVDSANVFNNCSTRFSDGFRYGFGAEVGVSTSKLHARGPVGLEGLVTYKYKLFGNGQIVGDYVDGRKEFRFIDR